MVWGGARNRMKNANLFDVTLCIYSGRAVEVRRVVRHMLEPTTGPLLALDREALVRDAHLYVVGFR